jgi:hypothetical protein
LIPYLKNLIHYIHVQNIWLESHSISSDEVRPCN